MGLNNGDLHGSESADVNPPKQACRRMFSRCEMTNPVKWHRERSRERTRQRDKPRQQRDDEVQVTSDGSHVAPVSVGVVRVAAEKRRIFQVGKYRGNDKIDKGSTNTESVDNSGEHVAKRGDTLNKPKVLSAVARSTPTVNGTEACTISLVSEHSPIPDDSDYETVDSSISSQSQTRVSPTTVNYENHPDSHISSKSSSLPSFLHSKVATTSRCAPAASYLSSSATTKDSGSPSDSSRLKQDNAAYALSYSAVSRLAAKSTLFCRLNNNSGIANKPDVSDRSVNTISVSKLTADRIRNKADDNECSLQMSKEAPKQCFLDGLLRTEEGPKSTSAVRDTMLSKAMHGSKDHTPKSLNPGSTRCFSLDERKSHTNADVMPGGWSRFSRDDSHTNYAETVDKSGKEKLDTNKYITKAPVSCAVSNSSTNERSDYNNGNPIGERPRQRLSVAIPPDTVAELASKYNALSTERCENGFRVANVGTDVVGKSDKLAQPAQPSTNKKVSTPAIVASVAQKLSRSPSSNRKSPTAISETITEERKPAIGKHLSGHNLCNHYDRELQKIRASGTVAKTSALFLRKTSSNNTVIIGNQEKPHREVGDTNDKLKTGALRFANYKVNVRSHMSAKGNSLRRKTSSRRSSVPDIILLDKSTLANSSTELGLKPGISTNVKYPGIAKPCGIRHGGGNDVKSKVIFPVISKIESDRPETRRSSVPEVREFYHYGSTYSESVRPCSLSKTEDIGDLKEKTAIPANGRAMAGPVIMENKLYHAMSKYNTMPTHRTLEESCRPGRVSKLIGIDSKINLNSFPHQKLNSNPWTSESSSEIMLEYPTEETYNQSITPACEDNKPGSFPPRRFSDCPSTGVLDTILPQSETYKPNCSFLWHARSQLVASDASGGSSDSVTSSSNDRNSVCSTRDGGSSQTGYDRTASRQGSSLWRKFGRVRKLAPSASSTESRNSVQLKLADSSNCGTSQYDTDSDYENVKENVYESVPAVYDQVDAVKSVRFSFDEAAHACSLSSKTSNLEDIPEAGSTLPAHCRRINTVDCKLAAAEDGACSQTTEGAEFCNSTENRCYMECAERSDASRDAVNPCYMEGGVVAARLVLVNESQFESIRYLDTQADRCADIGRKWTDLEKTTDYGAPSNGILNRQEDAAESSSRLAGFSPGRLGAAPSLLQMALPSTPDRRVMESADWSDENTDMQLYATTDGIDADDSAATVPNFSVRWRNRSRRGSRLRSSVRRSWSQSIHQQLVNDASPGQLVNDASPGQLPDTPVYVSSATSTIYIGSDVGSHDPSDYDLPEERHRSTRARSDSGRSAVLRQTCVEADNEESQELSVWMEKEAGDADDEWVDDGHLYEALESHYEHVEIPEMVDDVTTASDQQDKSHVETCDVDQEADSEDPEEGLEDHDPDSKKHGMQKLADAADGMKKKLKKNWRMTKSGINRMRIKSLSSGIDPAVLQVAAALPAKSDWQKRSKKKKHKQKDNEGIYQVLDKSTFYLDLEQLPPSLPSTPIHPPAIPAEVGSESDTASSTRSSVTLEGSDLQQLTSGEVTPTDCRRLSAQSYGEASARRISQVILRPRASPPAPPLPSSVSSSAGQTPSSPVSPSAGQTPTSVSCSTGQTTTSPVGPAESQTATVPVTSCTGPTPASLVNSAVNLPSSIAAPLLATSANSNEATPTIAAGASSQTHSALLLRSRSLHEESSSLSTLRAVASGDGNGLTSPVAQSQPSLLSSDAGVGRDLSEYTPSDDSKSEEEQYTSLLDKEPLYQLYMQGRCQEGVYSSGSSTSSDSGYEMVTSLEHLPVQLCVPPPPLPPPPPPCRQPHQQLPPPVRSSTIQLASRPSAEGQRSLWCQLPEVISSHVIETMTSERRRLQEAIFEMISSEASYLKSLTVLIKNFAEEPLFSNFDSPDCIISKADYKDLFSNAHKVLLCSERFLADLERKWQEDIMMSGVCDVIETHASLHFGVYKHYCANQVIQDRKLKQLKEKSGMFVECLQRLESSVLCQSLNLHSFLMLPMQRVTRLPLLVSAVLCRLDTDHPQFSSWQKTYQTVKNLAESCNEEACKNERLEELVSLNRQLVFKDMKSFPLVASHRWLVKKGEMTRTVFKGDDFKVTFGRKQTRQQTVHLFLFTDLLVISKKKGDETYVVLDYCMRNMIELTENIEDRPEKFLLTLLSNYEDKTVEMLFTCPLESERLRWMEAVTPRVQRSDTEEIIYESWDCPQVRVVEPHTAQQSDELTLQEGEVLKVLRKVPDGWYEGMKLSDSVSGWFPGHCCQEVVSEHVRARHLRQRYQLLQITGNFLQQQKQLQKRSKADKTDAPGASQ